MADESKPISQDEIEALMRGSSSKPAAAPPPTADNAALRQDEIEALLRGGAGASGGTPAQAATSGVKSAATPTKTERPDPSRTGARTASGIASGDVDFLLQQAEAALASINTPAELLPGATPFRLVDFSGAPPSSEAATLDLIRDVELDLRIELGRTNMYLEDVLKLAKGAVVPLDKLAGDPVDIYVNGRLIARGEVLILNDNFCVRVAELVAGENAA